LSIQGDFGLEISDLKWAENAKWQMAVARGEEEEAEAEAEEDFTRF
jgi:hypothetical protein